MTTQQLQLRDSALNFVFRYVMTECLRKYNSVDVLIWTSVNDLKELKRLDKKIKFLDDEKLRVFTYLYVRNYLQPVMPDLGAVVAHEKMLCHLNLICDLRCDLLMRDDLLNISHSLLVNMPNDSATALLMDKYKCINAHYITNFVTNLIIETNPVVLEYIDQMATI